MKEEVQSVDLLTFTAEIVSAHVSSNSVSANELPNLIASVHSALAGLGQAPADTEPVAEGPQRAVSIRKSLADPTKIISMIDGRPYTALKRHLATHGYDPKSYRETFGLPADYPLVAPAFAEKRREIAKTIGLGRKKVVETATKAVEKVEEAVTPKRGRKPLSLSFAIKNAKKHLAG